MIAEMMCPYVGQSDIIKDPATSLGQAPQMWIRTYYGGDIT